jgi:undecaprenyl-diphosphatase
MSHHLGWLESGVVGLLQGVSELFPVSSLGHSVLIPAAIGGSWARDLNVSSPESPYLAFIVGLHVATAAALIVYFRRDWVRIVGGVLTSIRHRRVSTPDERLAWLLILATIPVGLAGLLLEHAFRTVLAKPNPTALFLMLNGLILFAAERFRRRSADSSIVSPAPGRDAYDNGRHRDGEAVAVEVGEMTDTDIDRRLSRLPVRRAVLVGAAQIAALAPGISRSGITMAAGLSRGLDHEDAARFSFLLATPVILAAGVLKLPDLAGPLGDGIRGQVLLGSVLSFIGAYASVRFLSRYFRTNSLRPFAWYCLAAGAVALVLVNR